MSCRLDVDSPARSAAPPLCLHLGLQSSEADEVREVVGATQHPLSFDLQGPARSFRFHLHHHPLSRMAVTHAELVYEGRLRVAAPPIGTHYLLQIPLRGGSDVRHGSHRVTTAPGRRAVLLSPACPAAIECERGFEEVSIEVDAQAVHDAWASLTGQDLQEPLAFEPALRLDAEPGASILRLLRFVVDEVSRPSSALASPLVLPHLEEALLLCLLEGHAHSHSAQLRRAAPLRGASLAGEAEAWMEKHADRPLTIGAVADTHGVSVRTLQRTFEHHRGYTPRAFLRRVRLERVRTRLLRAGPDASVTRVAHEVGFAHLGRFSEAYRHRYGEPPSATLGRARRGSPPRRSDVAHRIDVVSSSGSKGNYPRVDGRCGLCAGEAFPA